MRQPKNITSLYIIKRDRLTSSLIDDCIQGDVRAQKKLFDLYYSDGMHVALRYSSSEEDAKEIFSSAFLRVFKKLEQFDVSKPFLPWFSTIIFRCSSDYYRYKKEKQVSIEEIQEPAFDPLLIDQLNYNDLLVLIQKLPFQYRQVFNLHTIEGKKHREIAALLGISEGTSKSNLSKAKAKMKALIKAFTG